MIGPYFTHLPVLLEALVQTNGLVVELGIGQGSTPVLHATCVINPKPRHVLSLDDDRGWFNELGSRYVGPGHQFFLIEDWDKAVGSVAGFKPSLVFVDHGDPATFSHSYRLRVKTAKQLGQSAEVVVLHDAEVDEVQGDKEFWEMVKSGHWFVDKRLTPWTLVYGWGESAQRVVSELLRTKRLD